MGNPGSCEGGRETTGPFFAQWYRVADGSCLASSQGEGREGRAGGEPGVGDDLGADVLDEGAGLLVFDAAGAEGIDVAGVAADPAAVCVAWLQPLRAMAAAARAAKSSEPSVRARPRQDRPVTGDMGTFPMLTTRHALEIRETGDGGGAKRC